MTLFLKITAGILLTAILSMVLSGQAKDFSLLLSLAVGCVVVITSVGFLQPVIQFAMQIVEVGQLDNELFVVMLKVAGIGFLSQIAGMVCIDAGNQSMCKVLQLITVAVMLWISLPLLEQVLSLMETILEAV